MHATQAPAGGPFILYDHSLLPAASRGRGRWGLRIVLTAVAALLLTIALRYDMALMEWRYRTFPQGVRGLLRQVLYGFRDFGQVLPICVAVVIILRCDQRRWTIIATLLIAQIWAGLFYNTGKLTIGRYRPLVLVERVIDRSPDAGPEEGRAVRALAGVSGRESWIGRMSDLNRDDRTQSFPSGHSAAAFAFAGVMAWFYPQLAFLFWTLATGCAASRYLDAVHWPSDCVTGACIGYVAAWLSLRPRLWAVPLWLARRRQPRPGHP
jgi:membrane-associated phospholipid phosphatase